MQSRSAEEIEQSTERLLRDLKVVVQEGEELLKAGAEHLTERGLAAREKLATALEIAKQTRSKLEQRSQAAAQATVRVVREHPYQSIGVAFGLGMLLGIIINRR